MTTNNPPSAPLTQSALAERIAKHAHKGQFRRDGKTPYWTHPEAVAEACSKAAYHDYVVAAAWLHDVLEDCPAWDDELLLKRGVCEEVVQAVCILTKDEDAPYGGYIAYVKSNEIARKVKVEDILHNLCSQPKPENVAKYAKAMHFLMTRP